MKNKYFTKKWLLTATVVNLFAVFTLLIYVPIESYLGNADEFWFPLSAVFGSLLLWALIAFAVLELLALLLPQLPRKILTAFVFAAGLLSYLQINFLNPNYGALGAEEMNWAQYEGHANVNTVIWIVLAAAVLLAVLLIRKKFVKTALQSLAGLLTVMQLASLVVLLLNMQPFQAQQVEDTKVLSREGIYSLGDEDGSILLFVVDTMDNQYFDETVAEHPELLGMFDGFTRFTNSSGSYSKTGGAVPYIISGIRNLNFEPAAEYAEYAFKHSALLNTLRENDYDIRCYTEIQAEVLADYVDNSVTGELQVTDGKPIAKQLLRYSLFRYAPEKVKPSFYTVTSNFTSLQEDCAVISQYLLDDALFYKELCSEKVSVVEGQKTFRLIHLFGSHAPFTLDEKGRKSNSATAMSQNTAVLTMLDEYFQQMKDAGVYDNTTIMIVADHSRWYNGDSIFFVKPAYSSGELQYSEKPVSHEDIHNTLFALTGYDLVEYGSPAFEEYDESKSENRLFYTYDISLQFEAAPYLPPLWEAEIIDDWSTPHYTGVIYANGEELSFADVAGTVKLDQTYDYTVMNEFFCPDSLSWVDSNGGCILGNMHESTMFFRLDEVPENGVDMTVEFSTWLSVPTSTLRIESEGKLLLEETYSDTMAESISFHIPSECFTENNTVVLRWFAPDAVQSADHRYITFGIKSFTVSK